MSQRSKARNGGLFVNGLIKADNLSEYDFKKKICDAWDYVYDKTLSEATEIDISNSEFKDFASSEIDEYSDIYFNVDKKELNNSEMGYKYIQQIVDFINNLEIVKLLTVTNKPYVKKSKNIIAGTFFLVKGEANYIYYEFELSNKDKNTWFLPYIFTEYIISK